jgi:hypothetical protein
MATTQGFVMSEAYRKKMQAYMQSTYGKLYIEARQVVYQGGGEKRKSLDMTWQAFQLIRRELWAYSQGFYCATIKELITTAEVKKKHIKNLTEVMREKRETSICRVDAGFTSGLYQQGLGSLDVGHEFYRETVEIANAAKEKELRKLIYFNESHDVSVRAVIDNMRNDCNTNVGIRIMPLDKVPAKNERVVKNPRDPHG